jgi:hypothetical protein
MPHIPHEAYGPLFLGILFAAIALVHGLCAISQLRRKEPEAIRSLIVLAGTGIGAIVFLRCFLTFL